MIFSTVGFTFDRDVAGRLAVETGGAVHEVGQDAGVVGDPVVAARLIVSALKGVGFDARGNEDLLVNGLALAVAADTTTVAVVGGDPSWGVARLLRLLAFDEECGEDLFVALHHQAGERISRSGCGAATWSLMDAVRHWEMFLCRDRVARMAALGETLDELDGFGAFIAPLAEHLDVLTEIVSSMPSDGRAVVFLCDGALRPAASYVVAAVGQFLWLSTRSLSVRFDDDPAWLVVPALVDHLRLAVESSDSTLLWDARSPSRS